MTQPPCTDCGDRRRRRFEWLQPCVSAITGRILSLLTPLLLGACVSLTVADTVPLPAGALAPPGSDRISTGGYRLEALASPGRTPDLLVLVSMSGGGKRSASFGYGALKGLRKVDVPLPTGPSPLLAHVDAIAGVSGGSFPATYYGLYRDAAFGRFETDFLYQDIESYIWGIYRLPWNWTWISDPVVGTNDFMERVYDRAMFHGATFANLARRGRPVIAIGATDLAYGTPILFTQEAFDLICADFSRFPVARAVAASNGFPGLFSPITLTNRAASCGGRQPGWLRRISEQQRHDTFSRVGLQARMAERYLNPERTRYLHLVDGGVSDNLALRAGGAMMQNIALSSDDLRNCGLDHVRRILVLSIDCEGTQDASVAQRKAVGGIFSLFGLVSGTQIDRYNFETLTAVNDQMRGLARSIAQARCAEARMVNGARCDDVACELIHISLAEMPERPAKAQLLAIPTGLTIQRNQVDALVAAGEAAITGSAPLRAFLATYPARTAIETSDISRVH